MNKYCLLTTALLMLGSISEPLSAQIVNPGQRAKDKGTQRANDRIDQSIDKGFDKLDQGLDNLFGGKKKNKQSAATTSGSSAPAAHTTPSSAGRQTDFKAYRGFDFIPGQHLLFFENFSNGYAQWSMQEWDRGEAPAPEVQTIAGQSGYWLRTPRKGTFYPKTLRELPEQCTIEFDMWADPETMSEMEGGLKVIFVDSRVAKSDYSFHFNAQPEVQLEIHPSEELLVVSALREDGLPERLLFEERLERAWTKGKVHHISISRNGSSVTVYVDQHKYMDLPGALPHKGKYGFLMATNLWGHGISFTNLRIATAIPNARTEMSSKGSFGTNTIYFDVNTARIRPESWSTLKEVAEAIKATSGSILITGHTDSDGANEANLVLSRDRAAAVKSALVSELGIPAARLQTAGKGAAEPVSANTSALGKAQNRRVVFSKL